MLTRRYFNGLVGAAIVAAGGARPASAVTLPTRLPLQDCYTTEFTPVKL